MKQRVFAIALISVASVLPLLGQGATFDTSGNAMLSNTYYFRHVLYAIDTNGQDTGFAGGIDDAAAVFGNITFNGSGSYTITPGTVSDFYIDYQNEENGGGLVQVPLSCYITYLEGGQLCTTGGTAVSGTYGISASGFGFITNPVTGDKIWGLVAANGVFVGSSTETSGYNDLFIAAPANSSAANSSFSGSYSAVGFWPGGGSAAFKNTLTGAEAFGNPELTLNASFQMNPNGGGSLGTLSVSGSSGGGSSVGQSVGASYNFSNGTAVVTFPTTANGPYFFGGPSNPEYLNFSPDGNFFFGGSPTTGFDMIVGVRNSSGTLNFQNLYYQAGLDEDESELSSGLADFDNYYGSLNATGSGDILIHQRLNDFESGTFGWTSADSFTTPIPASYTDTAAAAQYAVGAGGAVRIGEGIWPYLGLTVALQSPTLTAGGASISIRPESLTPPPSLHSPPEYPRAKW